MTAEMCVPKCLYCREWLKKTNGMVDVKKRTYYIFFEKDAASFIKRGPAIWSGLKKTRIIALVHRRTSNDIDIGQREQTIWKLIFPGQIQPTIWIISIGY